MMIKGKAKLEFGAGDIRITAAQSNGIGAVCLITQEPHEIGEKIPIEDGWNVTEAEVILTFSKPESIDSLIRELECAKLLMTGEWPEKDSIVHNEVFDFDAFMEPRYQLDKDSICYGCQCFKAVEDCNDEPHTDDILCGGACDCMEFCSAGNQNNHKVN